MRVITADEINRVLTYPALIEALREAFRADICSPLRHTHMIPQPSGAEAKYLVMPAWTSAGVPTTDDTDRRFRSWLAALIRDFWTRR